MKKTHKKKTRRIKWSDFKQIKRLALIKVNSNYTFSKRRITYEPHKYLSKKIRKISLKSTKTCH